MVQINEPEAVPSTSAGGEAGGSVPQQNAEPKTCKTTELLKQWPIIADGVKKGTETYQWVKHSCRLLTWALDKAEATANSVITCAGNNLTILQPAVKLADKALSTGVEDVQRRLPVVKESPEKVFQVLLEKLTKFIKPLAKGTYSLTEIGRKKISDMTKRVVHTYHGMTKKVDHWLDDLESYVNKFDPPSSVQSSATPSSSESSQETTPPAARSGALASLVRTSARAASALAAFYVGAAFWLASRAPLIGRLVDVGSGGVGGAAAAPSTSPATSPPSSLSSLSSASVVTVLSAREAQRPSAPPARPGSGELVDK